MAHFTSNTYQLKRKISNFSKKTSRKLSKPDRKFTADLTYGMLASKSCLLTDIADHLHEPSKKINVVDRLSRHLEKGTPSLSASAYLQQVKKMIPSDLVIHIDDSDVTKPDGHKFEALGIVRDGSESSAKKTSTKKAITLRRLTPYDAGDQQRYQIEGRCHQSGKNLFLTLEDRRIFPLQKQTFQFENFRVRKLKAINALNFYITVCMAFLAMISTETNALKVSILKTADPIKGKVFFSYYRLAKGISGILSYANQGVRLWFRTKRPAYRQLCLKLTA